MKDIWAIPIDAEDRNLPVRWRGALSGVDKNRLEQAIRRGIRRGIASAGSVARPGGAATFGELNSKATRYEAASSTITVPSYRDGGAPVKIPIQPEHRDAQDANAEGFRPPRGRDEIIELIRASFPETRGRPGTAVYYGVYVGLLGSDGPRLYYIRIDPQRQETVDSIFLYLEMGRQRGAQRLEPGFYTVTFEPHAGGSLHDLTRRVRTRLANPENLDLRVAFVVSATGATLEAIEKPRYRFYPRMHLLRFNDESPIATGSESVYAAVVDMWKVDENWRPTQISFLAFIGTFPDFRWEIRRLTMPEDPHDAGQLVRVQEGKDDYLRHTWEIEGDYQITCQVTVIRPDTSPAPARERLREKVILLALKMATLLAFYEREHDRPGAKQIWYRSIDERLKELRDLLATEKSKPLPNSALIDALQGVIDKINQELAPWVGKRKQPFPIHAIFTDQKTSKTQAVHLFLAFSVPFEQQVTWECALIDLTYEPFYRTYMGRGLTPLAAMIAAFEASRESLKRNYPPGHIRARVSTKDLEQQELANVTGFREWEFTTSTDSWQKDAAEWTNLTVQVAGATAIVASFVFPPSLVITGALVGIGLAGMTVSIANIIDRVQTNDFAWDIETFSDIANIAAAMVGLGAAATEIRAGALARALANANEASGESLAWLAGAAENASAKAAGGIASEAETLTLTRLASLAKLQRAMVLTGLGMDATNVLILGYGTYSELKGLDAYAAEERDDYIKQFGNDEGLKRWQQDRYTRILGILVRAGLQGAMLGISMKGAHERLGQARDHLGRPVRASEAPLEAIRATKEGPTATALLAEVDWLEREALRLRAEATEFEHRAARRPDRAERLQRRAAQRRRVAALLERDIPEVRQAARESEAAARTTALPGPQDVERMLAEAESETKFVRVELDQSERQPDVLPRIVRALLRSQTGNRVVYRVEGGTGVQSSKVLTSVSANGDVVIRRGETIHLNFGSPERAMEFLRENRPGGRVVRFEVDESWVQSLRSTAVPERLTSELEGVPRLVDVRFAEDQIQIPPSLIDELQQHIIPGTGQVAESAE